MAGRWIGPFSHFPQDPLAFLNEAALQAEIHEFPAAMRQPLVWIARQQWDRNWKRRYAELLSEQPELIVQDENYAL